MTIKEMMKRYIFFRDRESRIFVGRARTQDAAFTFRMGAGFAGGVNRSHPVNIEPALIDPAAGAFPTFYGQAVVADAAAPNGVRVPKAGDTAAVIYGITVRPFPLQNSVGANFGAVALGVPAVPPVSGPIDIMKSGYMVVTLQGVAAAFKGTPVQVNIVAGGAYLVGGFSVDTVSGTFVQLDGKSYFNGPADASGLVEIAFNI